MVVVILFGIVVFGIPCVLTVWNIYNMCVPIPKYEKPIFWSTLLIGGFFYIMLYVFFFDTAGDWYEALVGWQKHYSISSQYKFSIVLPTVIGILGLVILGNCDADSLSPLLSIFSIAAVILLNIIQIVFAVQLSKNVDGVLFMLYVYHANIFMLSVTAVRKHLRQQLRLYEDIVPEESQQGKPWIIRIMYKYSHSGILIFVSFFFLIAILEIIFIIVGQGADAPIKAFTDTAGWTFSQQIPPPPIDYDGHYLCTIAAGGHKEVVKPLRYGTRRGETIIVNRQLCIANAFEEYIQEKAPKFHKLVRTLYDKHGYPISKHITTPYRADAIYIIMKPLEWLFLLFLYMFDLRPEQRIRRQYAYVEG